MGLFDALLGSMRASTDINAAVQEAKGREGSVLLDVRSTGEFASGHIPGALNIPVDVIARVEKAIPDRTAPVYVYCASGVRAHRATSQMKAMGYTDVQAVGGIARWRGAIE